MIFGYARVSTLEQNLNAQIDELKKAGCNKIITDEMTGSVADRPGLLKLKEQLRDGDTIIVWRLDRLGRSLSNLVALMNEFEENGVSFKSLSENIDTTSTSGKLIFHMFSALSEFERNLIKERTRAGMKAARVRGRQGGRPRKYDAEKQKLIVDLYRSQQHSVQQICDMMEITKPTLYRYVHTAQKLEKVED